MKPDHSTTYTFHVAGMHCASCEYLIEDAGRQLPGVTAVDAKLADQSVTLTGEFGEETAEQVAARLTELIAPHGYTIATLPAARASTWQDFTLAIPAAALCLFLFVWLQKAGVVNLFDTTEATYGTVFLIGVIASLSSCMAVVGGILLSLSATFAKTDGSYAPQVHFHVGRLLSFFIFGGVIGAIGTVFTLSATMTFVLGLAIGVVLLVLGINLLDMFSSTKRLGFTMPKAVGRLALRVSNLNHTLTPFLVGVVTFFLPCGFTQSMQLYTLESGGFIPGALTMSVFALGTLPVLALVGYGSVSIAKSQYAGVFFKTAGLIVIAFAIINIVNSLVAAGYMAPVFTF